MPVVAFVLYFLFFLLEPVVREDCGLSGGEGGGGREGTEGEVIRLCGVWDWRERERAKWRAG